MGGGGTGSSPAALVALLAGAQRIGGGWSGHEAVFERERNWTPGDGSITASGEFAALSAIGETDWHVDHDGDRLSAGFDVHGRLAAIEGHGVARYSNEYVASEARADAMLGVEAGIRSESTIGPDGVEVSAHGEVFAGAQAKASGKLDVGGVEAGGHAEAWAGAGAEVDGSAKMTMDEVSVSFSLGVALGVGGSIGGKISVSPRKMIERLPSWL